MTETTMLLLNYSHPLTNDQLDRLERLLGVRPLVREIAVQIDREQALADAARELADAAGLAPREWQRLRLLLNPPGLAPLALALAAELHGRSGHFPTLVNIRPVSGAVPVCYEVAELIDLQAVRDAARKLR